MDKKTSPNIDTERYYDTFARLYRKLPEKKTCEDNIKHFERMLNLHPTKRSSDISS